MQWAQNVKVDSDSYASVVRNTRLNISAWTTVTELEHDCDKEFLLNGIINGFDIFQPDGTCC